MVLMLLTALKLLTEMNSTGLVLMAEHLLLSRGMPETQNRLASVLWNSGLLPLKLDSMMGP